MSIYLRKMMQDQIEHSKGRMREYYATPDKYEEWLLDVMTQDDPHKAMGSLTVICADLLELVRQADPSYGLTTVQGIHEYMGRIQDESYR